MFLSRADSDGSGSIFSCVAKTTRSYLSADNAKQFIAEPLKRLNPALHWLPPSWGLCSAKILMRTCTSPPTQRVAGFPSVASESFVLRRFSSRPSPKVLAPLLQSTLLFSDDLLGRMLVCVGLQIHHVAASVDPFGRVFSSLCTGCPAGSLPRCF